MVDLWNELDDSTVSVDNVTVFKRKLGKLGYGVCSGFNTDYGSSEPLKTLVMLCYVMLTDRMINQPYYRSNDQPTDRYN